MRCSAKRVTKHKVTFSFENGSARGTYTSSVGSAATFPSEGKAIQFAAGRLTVRVLTCPRCAACTESSPLLPHAVVVSLLTAGVKGASPLQLFLFEFFFLRRKKNG